MIEVLIQIFKRDLSKLKEEMILFEYDQNLWVSRGDVNNPAGNLCLHLIGNLNHFIGAVIGETGYVRDRKLEFEAKDVNKHNLLEMIDETAVIVVSSLKKMKPKTLKSIYPIQVFGEDMTYEYFLIHLATHLSYHLGQINYLRRMLEI